MAKVQITYRCHRRHGFFKRDVLIDDDPQLHARLQGVQFYTQQVKDQVLVCVAYVGALSTSTSGISKSLPALLFGKEFWNSHRVDPTNLWDWRRSAFVISMSATEKRLLSLLEA